MRVDFYQDAKGEWRWKIVSVNGKTVAASSEGFTAKHNCEKNLRILADFLVLWRK